MRRSVPGLGVALLVAVTAAGCALRSAGGRPAELRLSTNPDVRWEVDGPHDLAVIVENRGSLPFRLADPSAARVSVLVFEPPGTTPVCRKEAAAQGGRRVDLAPGERRALDVRLEGCDVAPGEYRYEAWYAIGGAPGSGDGARLGPEHGRIVVLRPAAGFERPVSRGAVSPPDHAEAPPPPAPANPHLRPAAPPRGPASLACTDRELASRGLNAWGDPAGTAYPEGPPTLASDVERRKMVLERYPDIATICRVPP